MAGIAAACAGPTPTPVVQIVEKTKVVEVQKKETVEVQKIVEKPIVVTATPAPTVAGADLAADQSLRFCRSSMGTLNIPIQGGGNAGINAALFMPLFIHDHKGNLIPWLATKYEANADFTVYTVHIDPRAVWSDGTPVKAQEAKDFWTWELSPETCNACYFSWMTGLDVVQGGKEVIDGKAKDVPGIVVKDDKTLEFRLVRPDIIFMHRLSLFNGGFAKMEDVPTSAEAGKNPWGKEAFNPGPKTRVNGPYMIKVWDVDRKQYELVLNPEWWGDKKPKLTRLVGVEIPDDNVSLIAWKNNEIDVQWWYSTIREQIRKTEPETFYTVPYPTNYFFYMDTTRPPMDDLNVRKALVHAVDWDKVIHAAFEGYFDDRTMKSLNTPELPCYKAANWPEYGYDPTKAKEELAKSKYGSVDKLGKIRIVPGGSTATFVRSAEAMAEQWKQNLGITDVDIKPGWGEGFGQDQDKIQVMRLSLGSLLPDAGNFLATHYQRMSDPQGNCKLEDAEAKKLLDELMLLKRDDPKYCTLLQQAEAKMLSNYPLLPMVFEIYEMNVKPWVKNFDTGTSMGWPTLLDMYITKH